jgi:hypothetical protein
LVLNENVSMRNSPQHSFESMKLFNIHCSSDVMKLPIFVFSVGDDSCAFIEKHFSSLEDASILHQSSLVVEKMGEIFGQLHNLLLISLD